MQEMIKKELINLIKEDKDVIEVLNNAIALELKKREYIETSKEESLQKIRELEEEIRLITLQKNRIENELIKKKSEIENKDMEVSRLKHQVVQKDNEIRALQGKCLECKKREDEVIGKYNDYKSKYSDIDSIYNKYLGLGESIIKRMERILNNSPDISKTPEIFMAYGIQENNIVALWESIAANYDFYDSLGKTDSLIEIFQYFLGLYEEISFKSIHIDCPNIGDLYDERRHTRTSSSSAVGTIQKVVLPGFSIGKSINKKSLVIVK